MKEKWVQINKIQGFEDVREYYWISNSDEDKIINRNIKKIKKIGFKNGYPIVGLITIKGKVKIYKIHILKAKAFLFGPNPLGTNLIRHLNDVKTDNRLENLAWGTRSDNTKDSIRNGSFSYLNGIKSCAMASAITAEKLSKPVKCIETGEIYSSAYEANRQLGIRKASIIHCCHGKQQTAGGYHWEYINKEVNNDELECKQIR